MNCIQARYVALICVHVLQIALIGGSAETCATYTCYFSYLDIVFLLGCCYLSVLNSFKKLYAYEVSLIIMSKWATIG